MFWDQLLPDLKWGLRVAMSQTHGYSPFEIVFKQEPSTSAPTGHLPEVGNEGVE